MMLKGCVGILGVGDPNWTGNVGILGVGTRIGQEMLMIASGDGRL
jgi:hypothetical protein